MAHNQSRFAGASGSRGTALGAFFDWATAGQGAPPSRDFYDSSNTSSSGSQYDRGRRNYDQDYGASRPYGPSRSYDYHRRSPPPYRGRPRPHHQAAPYHARRAASRSRSPDYSHRRQSHPRRGNPNARPYDRRGDEERLRMAALQSRPKTPPQPRVNVEKWVRTVFPPDINKADLDGNGHPICPIEVNSEDDDDYGSDSEIPKISSGWRTTEAMRQADAVAHEQQGRLYKRHVVAASPAIGRWAGKTLETADEAANLLRWVGRTEPSAFHFLHCERRQNAASEQYWLASTGRRKGPSRFEVPAAYDADGAHRADQDLYTYLGTALLGDDTTVVILPEHPVETSPGCSGSHTKLREVGRAYDAMEHRLWPHGLRINEDQYAPSTVLFATAYRNDVSAWYTVNALAPRRNRVGTSVDRAKFMEVLIRVLSVAGTYNRIAQTGEYVLANRSLEHYPFLAANITMSHVVAWLIQHGIARDGDGIKTLESFARSRRNWKENKDCPSATTFEHGGIPHHEKEMLALALGTDFDHWRDVKHAALQPNVESHYPSHPSAAMEDVQ
ncbi:hypothetical protein DFH06DRAFT_1327580 [Mycena polygramma]|nr:hypothetical protein DFH06DRAFT_1327580 [Mycena polygramma]